jgi:multiple sugar transport system substrate-binding protein
MPLKWQDEDKAYTGAQGGAAWTVSRHTSNRKLATDFVVWVTTANEYQGSAPTFPAYQPAVDVWAKTVAENKVYAENPVPVMREAAALVDPLWGNVRYDREGTFAGVVIAPVTDGKLIASAMEEYQNQLVALAQASGYEVVTQQ